MKWRESNYDYPIYSPAKGILIAMMISIIFWLLFCIRLALIVKAVAP